MPTGPLSRYRRLVEAGRIQPDVAQRAAVEKLQLLATRLESGAVGGGRGWLGAFNFGRRGESEDQGGGIYLYGGVGRGKSMLMDLFFDAAAVRGKKRVHFHAFMQQVHAEMNRARSRKVDDPIPPTVAALTGGLSLLCFDEMQVTDIADAMILGRLFEGIFARDIAVVATSNRHPTDLYKDGLQREQFVPFIDMIRRRLDVHQLDGGADFRLGRLPQIDVYHSPLGPAASAAMDAAWAALSANPGAPPLSMRVQGREVTIARHHNGVGRSSFADLCATPLGPADYLAIAEAHRTLFIDDIPALSRANSNEAKRFVTLVDALYEARVKLVCSAAAEPDALYVDGEGAFEFQRTASRLNEMRSADWFSAREDPARADAPRPATVRLGAR